MEAIGKSLIVFGIAIIAIGILFVFLNKMPLLGKLPGDIYIQRKSFSFYFPLTTSILISIIISMVLWLWSKK